MPEVATRTSSPSVRGAASCGALHAAGLQANVADGRGVRAERGLHALRLDGVDADALLQSQFMRPW